MSPWDSLLEFLNKLVSPDWGALVGLIPLALAALVVGYLGWVIRRALSGATHADPAASGGADAGPHPHARPEPGAAPRRGRVRLLLPRPPLRPRRAPGRSGDEAADRRTRPPGRSSRSASSRSRSASSRCVSGLLYWGREASREYDALDAPVALPAVIRPGPPAGVHVPGPSFRPLLLALAASTMVLGRSAQRRDLLRRRPHADHRPRSAGCATLAPSTARPCGPTRPAISRASPPRASPPGRCWPSARSSRRASWSRPGSSRPKDSAATGAGSAKPSAARGATAAGSPVAAPHRPPPAARPALPAASAAVRRLGHAPARPPRASPTTRPTSRRRPTRRSRSCSPTTTRGSPTTSRSSQGLGHRAGGLQGRDLQRDRDPDLCRAGPAGRHLCLRLLRPPEHGRDAHRQVTARAGDSSRPRGRGGALPAPGPIP